MDKIKILKIKKEMEKLKIPKNKKGKKLIEDHILNLWYPLYNKIEKNNFNFNNKEKKEMNLIQKNIFYFCVYFEDCTINLKIVSLFIQKFT